MSLIPCTECDTEISDKAISCPKCGCPIQASHIPSSSAFAQSAGEIEFTFANRNSKTKKGKAHFYFLIGITIVLLIGLVWLYGNIIRFMPNVLTGQPHLLESTSTSSSTPKNPSKEGAESTSTTENDQSTAWAEVEAAAAAASATISEAQVEASAADAGVDTSNTDSGRNIGMQSLKALSGEWCIVAEGAVRKIVVSPTAGFREYALNPPEEEPDRWMELFTCSPDQIEYISGRYEDSGRKYVALKCDSLARLAAQPDSSEIVFRAGDGRQTPLRGDCAQYD